MAYLILSPWQSRQQLGILRPPLAQPIPRPRPIQDRIPVRRPLRGLPRLLRVVHPRPSHGCALRDTVHLGEALGRLLRPFLHRGASAVARHRGARSPLVFRLPFLSPPNKAVPAHNQRSCGPPINSKPTAPSTAESIHGRDEASLASFILSFAPQDARDGQVCSLGKTVSHAP
jgi:hypothetical protein